MSNLYDFDSEYATTYAEKCICGTVVEVSTQQDKDPEYYTDICVRCPDCGRSVAFSLPVN